MASACEFVFSELFSGQLAFVTEFNTLLNFDISIHGVQDKK